MRTEIGPRGCSLQCQTSEKRKLASYSCDYIPGRNQVSGEIQTADVCKRVNLQPDEIFSETHTWTHFADFSRGVPRSHILPIETDFAKFIQTREFVSDLIEVYGFDLNCPIGRSEDNKFLPLRSMEILYVFRKECSFEGCPVFDRGCLPNE